MFTRLLPSMFLRRLLLLGGLFALATILPTLQLWNLTVRRGDEFLAEAEKRMVVERWIPTQRGRILDRKGRVLAFNRPSFDIAVDYSVISGQWARTRAMEAARARNRARWGELTRQQRQQIAEQILPEFETQLDVAWMHFAHTAGVPLAEVEARRNRIKTQVEGMVRHQHEARKRNRIAELEQRGRPVPSDATLDRQVARAIREETIAHVVLRGVDDRTAFAFHKLLPPEKGAPPPADPLAPAPFPGLKIMDSDIREYPQASVEVTIDRASFPGPLRSETPATLRVDGVGTHILGWMRTRIFKEDMDARPRVKRVERPDGSVHTTIDRGHYQEDSDVIGHAGLERAWERELRGLRGLEVEHLDSGEKERQPPEPGRDITLTLDIMLQARIQALFTPSLGLAVNQPWHGKTKLDPGDALNGAAVVIDIDSGDILALVSYPSFTLTDLRTDPGAIFDDKLNAPHINRAVSKPYQPGSIVKPLMFVAATTVGKLAPGGRISCTGHFLPNDQTMLRCWIYKSTGNVMTHDAKFGHAPDGAEAITVSCNIFFFELGRRLGVRGLTEWFARFGVGPEAELPDLGLGDPRGSDGRPQIFPGALGHMGRRDLTLSAMDAVQMAIGQGPISWTPLHAADSYATLARGGLRILPRLRVDERPREISLGLDPTAVEVALKGLRGAVEDPSGTGHHLTLELAEGVRRQEPVFNARGITVWGKTGTADAAALVDEDESGNLIKIRQGDHSWSVLLCGPSSESRPRYAVAVVVDYGGSGGRVAGPISNQVVHALIAEGYLPDARPAGGGQRPRP